MAEQGGYIYILTNPSFPEYVKIGYADNVDERLTQLNRSECTPFGFRKYAVLHVANRLADKNVHKLLDMFKPELRAKENLNGKLRVREFFAMSPEDAADVLGTIGGMFGETPIIYAQTAQEKKEQKIAEEASIVAERKSPFSFFKCGIKVGEEVIYIHDNSIVCTVAGDREILYQGKTTSLSALAKKLLHRDCGVQGTLHFSYKGEVLSALRKRLEDEGQYRENEPIDTHTSFSDKDNGDDKNGISLYFTTDKYTATCVWNDDGFLLLKDSKLSISNSKSCPNAIVKMREEKSTIINGERVLSENILFTSSSAAAKFVAGSSVSGNICWKNADGVLLKTLQKGE